MPSNRIELTIVVSGAPTPVEANLHEKVEVLERQALHKAGQLDPNLAEWELKTGDGVIIPTDQTLAEASITAGMTLFLSKIEGGGG